MKKVLVIAVHPDDETLGCGGTLLKHKANGDDVTWVIATGVKKEDGFTEEKVKSREKEIEDVNAKYGFSNCIKLNISTMKVDQMPIQRIVNSFGEIFSKIKPEIVYMPYMHDVHSDHRVVFDAAYSCTKTFRHPFIKKLLMMETISETECVPPLKDSVFIPNYFVDISAYLDEKIEIMKVYESELGKHPFPRTQENIKALATFRGTMSGCRYAESFMILKEIC